MSVSIDGRPGKTSAFDPVSVAHVKKNFSVNQGFGL
jgi:hypothetical protein